MNFALAGSPDFAAWVLEHLTSVGRPPLVVLSQPDRPRGRGRRPAAPPAVVTAHRLGLPCLQVEDINAPSVLAQLDAARVSVLVVASFGQILRKPLLDSLLCINIHASLLPAYRGAAPIERALIAGEEETGVTIMRVTEELDAGPWALQTRISINLTDDAGSLRRALALLGALGVDQVLTSLADGTVTWTEQGESGTSARRTPASTTYAHKLTAADCQMDPRRGSKAFHDLVRALSPRVGVRARSGQVEFKIWRTWPYGQPSVAPPPAEASSICGEPGRLKVAGSRLFVGCSEGVVEILAVQPSGRPRMTAAAFLRGYRAHLGDTLEAPSQPCDVDLVEH